MFMKFGLPTVSFALLTMTVAYVVRSAERDQLQSPPVQPSTSPFQEAFAAAGIVEAQTEDIEIGTPISGIVAEVFVEVGQLVQRGDPLFRLDDRKLQSQAESRRADLARAQAEYDHLMAGTRPEQIAAAEADLVRATSQLALQRDRTNRVKKLFSERAVTEQTLVQSVKETEIAEAEVKTAAVNLDLLRNGASKTERQLAAAEVRRSETQLEEILADLERLTVRAYETATVLQVNLHVGEYVGTPATEPLLIMGNIQTLHVRVDVDEFEIPRLNPGATANAFLKGHPETSYRLRFVRVEGRVVPKRSLTGYGSERIDTRVLQVIYEVEPHQQQQLYVGQLVDVYIDADAKSVKPDEYRPGAGPFYATN